MLRTGTLVLLALALPPAAAAQVTVRGLVREAESAVPLSAAHVVVDWGELGTITNRLGRFELVLPSLPAVLMVRFVGFETRRVAIGPNDSRDVTVDLLPAVYTLDELVITGADFAENVMRKVILRKQVRREHLTSYKAGGYTRITLENRDQIVLVSERVFDS